MFRHWAGLLGKSRVEAAGAKRRRDLRRSGPRLESLEGRLLLNAGYFDKSFAKTGRTIVSWPGSSSVLVKVEAEAIQSDGRIILVGEIPVRAVSIGRGKPRLIGDIGVVRLNTNGSLDQSFGTGGRDYLAFGAGGALGTDRVRGVAIDPQGRIVLAGNGLRADGTSEIVTERLNTNGTIDKSYGISGRSYANSTIKGSSGFDAQGVVIDGQGRIVVAATVLMNNGQNELGAIRLATNGNYDQSFGVNGQSHYLLARVDVNIDKTTSLALDSNRGILIAGTVSGDNQSLFAVVRLLDDGNADPSFGNLGRNGYGVIPGAIVSNPFGLPVYSTRIAVKAGGIVLVGTAGASNTAFAAAQLLRNGVPDPNFGVNGFSTAGYPLGTSLQNMLGGMVIDTSGRIVIAGGAFDGKKYRSVVTRLLSNGSFDTSFGVGGRSDLGFGKAFPGGDAATTVAIDPQGRIVTGGWTNSGSFSAERINA